MNVKRLSALPVLLGLCVVLGCASMPAWLTDLIDQIPDVPDTPLDPEPAAYPWAGQSVQACGGRGSVAWPETFVIQNARVSGGLVKWDEPGPRPDLGRMQDCTASLSFITQIDGVWCEAFGEWLHTGMTYQTLKTFQDERDGKHLFSGPLRGHEYDHTREYWIRVNSCATRHTGPEAGSNWCKVQQPQ